ncbi:MAG: ADP-forming succinate--CoA ligase subunit beta [Chloroflexi bacterium]|nr:ADP-forming succinate--CoA ligase subunit beta [Chloroflexota bacterium]MCI0790766.1 ADP-forming succinate--CoA ligase subunit beta [Chloroflexota bacterium]MCI0795934.1 ADP-forming succinate--CoA ligase subunit beta [Chloroflexota bacterium]MCI0812464.1 ADP-forming succinate--CoA ligase subunit beta [Chloroflexota bacterium]MCI0822239.1 ADP-forming succinate--CoA ligase subunit beta [Chloroflexota bacterium]
MKIHEYQAKEILARYGVPIPKGGVADSPEAAKKLAEDLGGSVVVKAQVHAGGRGKAGGVKLVSTADEAGDFARSILGTRLVTIQTGPEGVPVRKVLVEETIDVADELYLAMLIDGAAEGVVAIASEAGGMEIEQVAEETPDKILRVAVDPVLGLQPYQGRRLAYGLNVKPELVGPISALVENLYRLFQENDCSLAEINPLVITSDGRVLAVDAKLTIDDEAMFRHKDLDGLHDPEQEDAGEVEARKFDINYVKLDGTVGCIVNGAGLAMATMDVVLSGGAQPANFLDIGGGADEDKVANALRIVLMDSDVELVLINIFGGILRCDMAARGFVQRGKADPSSMRPMVVRMLGTNAEEGRKTLQDSGLDVTLVEDLPGAAEAVRAAIDHA